MHDMLAEKLLMLERLLQSRDFLRDALRRLGFESPRPPAV